MARSVCCRHCVKQASYEIRSSGAYAPPFPNFQTGMPSFFALSARLPLDAGAGEDLDPDREDVEHLIVTFERCCLGGPGPVRLERDLRHPAMVGPAGGNPLGVLR